jgi:phage terminase large subunit-like protein
LANKKSYKKIAVDYARAAASGELICGREVQLAAQRFLSDLEREDLELHTKEPDFVIGIIERLMVHKQGEAIDGTPLMNQPLILQPWQVFVVYNLIGFYFKGTKERRYKEAFIMVPRKNGKTITIAALAFSLAILERKSGAKIYIVAGSQKQACESFSDIIYSLRYKGMIEDFRVRDNNAEHSIHYEFQDEDGTPTGSIDIEALASNPDAHDSFNCNIAIADEIHSFKKAAQYNRFKEAMKAYTNKLMVGITTAGDNANSFCYRRMEYAIKVVDGTVKDDSLFSFVSRADQSEDGQVDYTDPLQHQKANPSYGVTIRPEDIMNDALQAQNDPQQRKDFLSRSLNLYTTATRAWFDVDEVRASDAKFNWTLDELAALPIDWYGGADLSRMYDLTAAALYGEYNGVDICITHAFFPITQAAVKADQDQIPLFGWADDGWLTMCNSPTVNAADVVNWFVDMRKRGFRIRQIGHDRKFAGEEYFPAMKAAGFNVIDQPQYFYLKSQGFRHIEKAIKDGRFYYLHSEAYEYCISNVRAIEKTDDAVQYEKIQPEHRIDLFDASVFACIRMAEAGVKKAKAKKWFGEE